MSKLNIILLSASLMALGAFSIDTILPSISYLKNERNLYDTEKSKDIYFEILEGEIKNDFNARIIRDGNIVYNGKIGSIFREKNQAKQVSAGLECGITLKDFNDYQKKDIIEVFNSTSTERTI